MSRGEGEHPLEILSASLDGELSAGESARLRSHLAGCEGCSRMLEELRAVDRALAAEEAEPVPAHLEGRIRSRIRGADGGRLFAFPLRRWRLPAAAAAGLAGLLALWVAFTGFEGPGPVDHGVDQPVIGQPVSGTERTVG